MAHWPRLFVAATGDASEGYQRAAVIVNQMVLYSLLVAVVIWLRSWCAMCDE